MRLLIYTGWPVKAWRIPDEQVARIRAALPDVDVRHVTSADDAARSVTDADVGLIPWLTTPILSAATQLRWVHSTAAAVGDLLPLDELARRHIVVTNSRGVQAVPMAEQVMAGLLALARRLDLTILAQRDRRWIQAQLGEIDRPWLLRGKSMTIVGLGSIGMAIAERAHAFGIRITGVRRRPSEPAPSYVRVAGADDLDDALRGADIVVIAAPAVPATMGMLGEPQLSMLARGAILVNVGRAQLVDTNAMVRALESGQLGGAVLDVFDTEPLDAASPLWSMPNVIITPHSAGFRADHWQEVTDLFIENVGRYQRGVALLNVVDPVAGY
ncbi:MAG: D-2-hydroxyacid dehydrogenase [bacterium]